MGGGVSGYSPIIAHTHTPSSSVTHGLRYVHILYLHDSYSAPCLEYTSALGIRLIHIHMNESDENEVNVE